MHSVTRDIQDCQKLIRPFIVLIERRPTGSGKVYLLIDITVVSLCDAGADPGFQVRGRT